MCNLPKGLYIFCLTFLCLSAAAQDELNLWPGPAVAGALGGNIISVTHEFSSLPTASAVIDNVTFGFQIGSIIKTSLPARWYVCTATSPLTWVPFLQYFAGDVSDATVTDQAGNFTNKQVDPILQQLANQIKDITATVNPTTIPPGYEAELGGYAIFRISHGLNTTRVIVSVYRVSDGNEIFPIKYVLDQNTVVVEFGRAYPVASFRCVITKTGDYGVNSSTASSISIKHTLQNPVIFRLSDNTTKSEYMTSNYLAQLVGESSIELTFGRPQAANTLQVAVASPRNANVTYSIGSSTNPSTTWSFTPPSMEDRTPTVVVYDAQWNLADPLITYAAGTITVTFGRPVAVDNAYTMWYCYNSDLAVGQWIDIPGNNWKLVPAGTVHGSNSVPFDMADVNVYGDYKQHSATPYEVGQGATDTTLTFYHDLNQWVAATTSGDDLSFGSSSGSINLINDPVLNWLTPSEGDKLNLWGDHYKIGIETYAMKFVSDWYFRFYPFNTATSNDTWAVQFDMYGNIIAQSHIQAMQDLTAGDDVIAAHEYKFANNSTDNAIDFGYFALKHYRIGLSQYSMDFDTDRYFWFKGGDYNPDTNPTAQVLLDVKKGQLICNRVKFQTTYSDMDVANPALNFEPNEFFMSNDGSLAFTEPNMDISKIRYYTADEIISSSTLSNYEMFKYIAYVDPASGITRYAQFADRIK